MPVNETTPELEAALADADTLVRIPLGHDAAAALGAPSGHVQVAKAGGEDAPYLAVLHGQGLFEREMLCRSDSLEELLRLSQSLVSASTPAEAALARSALAKLTPGTEPWELTPEQVATSATYADGDFSHLAEIARTKGVAAYDRELGRLGDGFFAYVMRELDPREDCTDGDTALQRVQSLIDDLQGIEQAVLDAESSPSP